MAFSSLFDIDEAAISPARKSSSAPKKKKLILEERGCKFCPLNKVHGITKIMGTIKGRKILVVPQSPGPEENAADKELVGPSGQLFWTEMRSVGILRKHCDVFNVVRCFPADRIEGSYNEYLKMRSPTKAEIHCCSIYTEKAMAESQATQIIVLGQVAAKALLNLRSMPEQKSFWHPPFNAKIYLLDHPSFFVRGYGQGPRMDAFRSTLQRVAEERGVAMTDMADGFAYIKAQDYRLVVNGKQARKAERSIRKYADKGFRVSVDIEADIDVDTKKYEVFCVGFCPKPGLAFVFVFKHMDVAVQDGKHVLDTVRSLIEDSTIPKVLHYGVSDSKALLEL